MYETATQSGPSPAASVAGLLAELAEGTMMINRIRARQLEIVALIAASETRASEDGTLEHVLRSGWSAATARVDAGALVAPGLGIGQQAAQGWVDRADKLAGPLVAVREAMAKGLLDERRATVICDELEDVPEPVAREVAERVADDVGRALVEDPTGHGGVVLKRRVQAAIAAVDAACLQEKVTRARSDRRLRRWAESPGVDAWMATLPAERAATAWAAIDTLAQQLRRRGEADSIEQARADALLALIEGRSTVSYTLQVAFTAGVAMSHDVRAKTVGRAWSGTGDGAGARGVTAAVEAEGAEAVQVVEEVQSAAVTGAVGSIEVSEASQVSEASHAVGATEATEATDVSQVSEASQAVAATEVSQVSEANRAVGATEATEVSQAVGVSEATGATPKRQPTEPVKAVAVIDGSPGTLAPRVAVSRSLAESALRTLPVTGVVEVAGLGMSQPLLADAAWLRVLLDSARRGGPAAGSEREGPLAAQPPGGRGAAESSAGRGAAQPPGGRGAAQSSGGRGAGSSHGTGPRLSHVAGRVIRGVVERALHPATGALVDPGPSLDSDGYRPSGALAAFVKSRDGRCRFPGCSVNARFCDLDHVRPWPLGPTCASNLLTLCRRHHRVKQAEGWRVAIAEDGAALWVDPLDRRFVTQALDHRPAVRRHDVTAPSGPRSPRRRRASGATGASRLEARLSALADVIGDHVIPDDDVLARGCRIRMRRPAQTVRVLMAPSGMVPANDAQPPPF